MPAACSEQCSYLLGTQTISDASAIFTAKNDACMGISIMPKQRAINGTFEAGNMYTS